ncbi:MAG: flavodoxin [Ruminobacter sp.]|nr:flavodoxin [Ruminobacter sp.]
MSKIGIFYGSDTGHTEEVANLMYDLLAEYNRDIFDVRKVEDASIILNYDLIILGTPTWYLGELQSDMDEFKNKLSDIDITNKTFALFGLGDQIGYSEFFVDGMGKLYNYLKEKNAKFVGKWSTEGYTFTSVLSLDEDNSSFVGLPLDADNQEDLTVDRVYNWLEQLKEEANLEIKQ